jgi:hypothetical protein
MEGIMAENIKKYSVKVNLLTRPEPVEFANVKSIGLSPTEHMLVIQGETVTTVYPIENVEFYEFSEIKNLIQ